MTAPSATRPLTAAACVIAAMAVLGLTDNLVMLLADRTGLWQFHLVRAVFALPVILAVAAVYRLRLQPVNPRAVALRSLLVAGSMFCYFGALAFVPVAQAAAGLFTAPVWVVLISFAGIGPRVAPWNILAALAGFGGALLVLRPDLSVLSPALALPLAAGVLYALGAIATRRHCAGEGTLTLLTGFFLSILSLGALGCLVLANWQPPVPDGAAGFLLRGWRPLDPGLLGLIAVQALGAVIGVGLITRGYLLAEAAFVSVFEYTLLIFGGLWGWVLWEQGIDATGALGIVLIIVSGIVLTRATRTPTLARPAGAAP